MSDKKTFHTMEDQPGIKVDPWILKSQICDMIKYSTAAVDRKLADPESNGTDLRPYPLYLLSLRACDLECCNL